MVSEGPDRVESRIIRTEYPVEEGIVAGTTKQVNPPNIEMPFPDGSTFGQGC